MSALRAYRRAMPPSLTHTVCDSWLKLRALPGTTAMFPETQLESAKHGASRRPALQLTPFVPARAP